VRSILALLLLVLALPAAAADPRSRSYIGLLRARDLTPFGLVRLDMRPAHAVAGKRGDWAVELELGYQNTWALSPGVETYLKGLSGRRDLGPVELQEIRDLPGENYLLDMELGLLDMTFHYAFSQHWSVYAVVSGVSYSGGFLDGTIESFHDSAGFSDFGRPAVRRDDVNVILDLKSTQFASFGAPTDGGLLDPTFGIRYSGVRVPTTWNLVLELATKLPLQGFRPFLSSGRTDVGFQASLQKFSDHHAVYASLAAVYYDGNLDTPRTQPQTIPTLILGYERKLTARTHLIIQAYASQSVYSRAETDLDELLKNKYQLSLGAYHRRGRTVFSFALTENTQNLNNTPDVGFQMGFAYSPALLQNPSP
jgi:hypothetical protein